MTMNGYRCFSCSAVQSADYAGYLCPLCGGNLDISYDYDEAAKAIGEGFSQTSFDLFRFAALLPLKQPRRPLPLRIGCTPLYHVRRIAEMGNMPALYLKDETLNPSASLKDRASAVAIGRALDVGARVVAVAAHPRLEAIPGALTAIPDTGSRVLVCAHAVACRGPETRIPGQG